MSRSVGPTTPPFLLPMEVRDHECDMEAIVNNSVYMNYLEHARHRYFRTLGVSFADLTASGVHPIVVRAEIDYRRPLRSGDHFVVSVQMERVTKLRFAFVQEIRLWEEQGAKTDDELAAHAARLTADEFNSFLLAVEARITATAITATGRPLPLEKWGDHAQMLAAAIGPPAGN